VIDPYWASGCDVCRTSWRLGRTIDEELGRSASLDQTIFHCRVCGTFWQTTGHDAVLPISEERAAAALAGHPLPWRPARRLRKAARGRHAPLS
jgi:hypothetical protein